MNDGCNINIATSGDTQALVQLVNSAYRGDMAKKGWTHEADLLDGIRIDENAMADILNKPEAVILKALNEKDNLIGCVYLQKKGRFMYLGMLTVAPGMQAKGIGKTLVKAAENYTLLQNCQAIQMTVISVRNELINWYERLGYHKTGETEPFPNDPRFGIPRRPLEFLIMEKEIL